MATRNSKPMASAQAMSLCPRRVCHPGRSLQALQRSPMTTATPMLELASEKALRSTKVCGGEMESDVRPVEMAFFHQTRSLLIALSGRCSMNGLLLHTASMRSRPVR